MFRVDSSTTLMPTTPGTPPTPEQPSTESYTEDTLNSVLDIIKAVVDILSKRLVTGSLLLVIIPSLCTNVVFKVNLCFLLASCHSKKLFYD